MMTNFDIIHDLIVEKKEAVLKNKQSFTDEFIFQKGLDIVIDKVCSNKISFAFYSSSYQNALKEARHNNLQNAQNAIDRAKKHINLDLLSDHELKIYSIISNPVEAYLNYKKADYEASILNTTNVIRIDGFLESEYPILFFHKIQQLHNVARIYCKTKQYEKASHIINLLFTCIICDTSIEWSGFLFDVKLFDENDTLRYLMGYQVFLESISYISFIEDETLKIDFFEECFDTVLKTKSNDLFLFVFLWTNTKKEFYKKSNNYLNLFEKTIINSGVLFDASPLQSLLLDLSNYYDTKNENLYSLKVKNLFITNDQFHPTT
jgi:hypothetical protein